MYTWHPVLEYSSHENWNTISLKTGLQSVTPSLLKLKLLEHISWKRKNTYPQNLRAAY